MSDKLPKDYVKVAEQKDSRAVIVYFSSVGVPRNKFNGERALKDFTETVVYINCHKNSWYLDGIEGWTTSVRETADAIKQLTDAIGKDKKIIYYGGSMGGFAATLYGGLNNCDLVLATGVETNLLKPGGYADRLSLIDLKKLQLPDLKEIVQKSTAKFEFIYGELAPEDYFEIQCFDKQENVTITSFPNCGHQVPFLIEKVIGLQKLFADNIQERFVHRMLSGSLNRYPFFLNYLANRTPSTPDKLFNILENRRDIDPIVRSYLFDKLAREFYKGSNFDMAKLTARISIALSAISYKPFITLANICRFNRDIEGYCQNYSKAAQLLIESKTDSLDFLYLEWSEGLFEMELYKESIEKLKCIKNTYPVKIPMGKRILDLSVKLGSYI